MINHREVEAREMEQLGYAAIGQQFLQPRRGVGPGRELHEMCVPIAGRQLDEAQPVAMRVEPHRLGVDRNNRSEVEPFGQITPIKLIRHPGQRTAAPRGGAQEKTRTSTSFRPLEPESSASTNSATWASRESRNKPRPLRCQSATLPGSASVCRRIGLNRRDGIDFSFRSFDYAQDSILR